jgi:predicted anti-sigma-YlaC factor YlaD
MKDCGDCRENILLYLHKELSVSRLIEFRAHLEKCEACRQVLEAEEELSRVLHRSRPLYSAPATSEIASCE